MQSKQTNKLQRIYSVTAVRPVNEMLVQGINVCEVIFVALTFLLP